MSPFTSEGDGLFTCSTTSLSEREVYAAFQDEHGDAIRDLTDDAKILFKVSIDDNTPLKPGQKHTLVYAGISHTAKLSQLLQLFNKKYCKGANQEGAFLLTSGYALKPDKSCGGVFMQHGLEITFHTVVDFTRLAYAA